MTRRQTFFKAFRIGLSIFLLLNILAAHLLSDCGLPGFLGLDACSDDISRAGFPFVFYEDGGFTYHSGLNLSFLLLDLFIGLDLAIVSGYVYRWYVTQYQQASQ